MSRLSNIEEAGLMTSTSASHQESVSQTQQENFNFSTDKTQAIIKQVLEQLKRCFCCLHTELCVSLVSCAREQQGDMRQSLVLFVRAPDYQSNTASSDVVIVFILPRTRTSSPPHPPSASSSSS
ncbi:unnamed protein product [Pleuronectes platessa]|uniref:Uncharacterized protein n=1 Tax=Pleuronectes platessa TaxID=8262 RepID=A0A9N7TPE6_PLEPL|nr:unnamed protein product [Pleuronectes platessa]